MISPQQVMERVSQGRPYTLLLLTAGRDMDLEEEAAGRMQMEHLAHLFTLEEEGKASVFGPVSSGERLRGIIVFNTTNKEAIGNWMSTDPYIKGGYLGYELHDFFTLPGQKVAAY